VLDPLSVPCMCLDAYHDGRALWGEARRPPSGRAENTDSGTSHYVRTCIFAAEKHANKSHPWQKVFRLRGLGSGRTLSPYCMGNYVGLDLCLMTRALLEPRWGWEPVRLGSPVQ